MAKTEHIRENVNEDVAETAEFASSDDKGEPQTAGLGPVREALDRYLDDLARYSVLTAEQEIALGQEIERLEIAHWVALLGYEPALPVMAREAAAHIKVPRELTTLAKAKPRAGAGSSKAPARADMTKLAERLREADATRTALFAVDRAVCDALAEEPKARTYLRRVAKAREAQHAVKQRFVAANLRLVVAMARRVNRRLLPLEDLIQEGNLGLLRAVERFDHRRGLRFSTYAAWWIRHGLNRALSDKARLVRVPVHAIEDAQRLRVAESKLTTQQGGDAKAVAAKAGLSESKAEFLRTHVQQPAPLSLDQRMHEDGATLGELMTAPDEQSPEQQLERNLGVEQLRSVMHVLSPMEQSILCFRFGLEDGAELTLREIGAKYNLSRERIRQIQEEALLKLRSRLSPSAPDGQKAA